MDTAIGVALLALGASGAAQATGRLPAAGLGRLVLPALVVAGAVIGVGGALVRGWDLVGSAVAGAVVVPGLAVVVRLVERRHEEAA